jgi:transaldolase
MKLFLDTANLTEIEDALGKGVISGVTTNPSLMSKEPKTNFMKHIITISNLCKDNGDLPLSVEVFASDISEMYDQALDIYDKVGYDNLNIKIPVGYKELEIINKLDIDGIPVNCTCCFTTTQMQLAAAAGARYVSLFYNRLIDFGGSPLKVLRRTSSFIEANDLNCEIIAGSIRNTYDLEDAWDNGAHIVTAGYKVVAASTKHPKTDESVKQFLKDFEAWMK